MSLLPHPQKVGVLLDAALQVEFVELLSAHSILPKTETEEGLLFVQVASALSVFQGEDCESVLHLTRADLVFNQLEDAALFLLALFGLWSALELQEGLQGFLLVVDKFIFDVTVQSLGLQLLLPFLLVFSRRDQLHLLHLERVFAPLASQVLLAYGEEPSAPCDLNQSFGVLWAVLVHHVQRRVQNCDALFVAVDVLFVRVRLSLNLASHCVHEVRNHLFQLAFVFNRSSRRRLYRSFNHADRGVHLSDS